MSPFKERIQEIQELKASMESESAISEYRIGVINGIEYALSVLLERDPHWKYLKKPVDASTESR
jgi:hypothetical protein